MAIPQQPMPAFSAQSPKKRKLPWIVGGDEPEAAADVTLTPKITGKHCFGSAGCNVSKYDQDEISLSTRSSSTRISVKVTDIVGIPG